jgi:hypothetical protein
LESISHRGSCDRLVHGRPLAQFIQVSVRRDDTKRADGQGCLPAQLAAKRFYKAVLQREVQDDT